ncbi:VOC family protein [Mesorhizobium sp. LHD-90]|uniref:VOC family protein n=1 Tax=Mesorhizobium sp. LHD-90 TaxID=3071414 RepID=UPI0027E0AEF8|nr:VOC family protein [Mesorhizobium sp. LHD-90]MDQ6437705.1 VOC family protein [Mesorhizobium sp. LHD-90]
MTALPRPLDHLVLPTASLETARARLTALGFTVAPAAVHPFGTANACVFFADGTYLEPLAIANEKRALEGVSAGNVFVARDAAFRQRRGPEGFSALVFGTDDALADHEVFVGKGVSAGDILDFSRGFTDAAGNTGSASFRLAFAADQHAPDVFFFTCQRVDVPNVDRAALQSHRNGVTGIAGVVLSAREPARFSGIVGVATGAVASAAGEGPEVRMSAGNTAVEIVGNAQLASHYGLDPAGDAGLHARAIRFSVAEIARASTLLGQSGLAHDIRDGRIVVPPAPGQGAAFIFEESP